MTANKLRELRLRKEWSVREAGERLGLSKGTYAGYEYGRRMIPNELLPQIADLYGVSIDYIFGHSETGEEQQALDLDAFLEQREIMYHGAPLTDEDKRRIQDVLIGLFWETKGRHKK